MIALLRKLASLFAAPAPVPAPVRDSASFGAQASFLDLYQAYLRKQRRDES